ncbi:MAG: hypothetical protein N3C59_10230 [Azovibrio sp.]|nr:hypothetical protein [Azovibrio sp.]
MTSWNNPLWSQAFDIIVKQLEETPYIDLRVKSSGTFLGVYDIQSGLMYPGLSELKKLLESHEFLYVTNGKEDQKPSIVWHRETRMLWTNAFSRFSWSLKDAKGLLETATVVGLTDWKLPTKDQLYRFAKSDDNPFRDSKRFRLRAVDVGAASYWLVSTGRVDVDEGYWGVDGGNGGIFACLGLPRFEDFLGRMILQTANHGLHWRSVDGAASFRCSARKLRVSEQDTRSSQAQALSCSGLVHYCLDENLEPYTLSGESIFKAVDVEVQQEVEADWKASRLPKLEPVQLSDPNQGLWELWGVPEQALRAWSLVGRNPALDVRSHPVAIDFGTSSTVVAIFDGREPQLLRIGARDFYSPVEPQQFENPTVLECLDYAAFHREWTRQAYRPEHDWDWMRVGHEALESWRDNKGDIRVLSSILPRLKAWAMRGDKHPPLKLTDRSKAKREVEIPPLSDRRPVRGEALKLSADDPFDPIEFYAYQLGMVINWRRRGIFFEYYLSFPVKFERAVKDRVVASFMRGLQRSFPPALIAQGEVLTRLRVQELASEPAAYAASALRHLGLQPTEGGLGYAVFDFGGGTADFDFGLWRSATPQEDDEGYEEVFEHLASSGDNFLGGEQLLEHLAYRVFCQNLDALRDKRIHFTRPIDAERFAGDESFVQPTQAAQTNTVILINVLRPFWEGGEKKAMGQTQVQLLDAEGNKQNVALAVDAEALDAFLAERIGRGARLFLREMARAFADWLPERGALHVLLAGNASRSRYVSQAFDVKAKTWPKLLAEAWGGREPPQIEVHMPLPIDPAQPFAPTAKTGVALGLLRLAPGMGAKLIDHVRTRHGDEAPFQYFVGRVRRGEFQTALDPDSNYGQWRELGSLGDGVFNLYYTTSSRARAGMKERDAELFMQRISRVEAGHGARLWVRALGPTKIELALGMAGAPPAEGGDVQPLDLSAS